MKKATPNRFLTAGRPGVFKVKMSLGRAMKTTDLNGGLNGGFGTLGPASDYWRDVLYSKAGTELTSSFATTGGTEPTTSFL